MADRKTTLRMFTHMINMMEQHNVMTISCGDPLMELLKDVRELLKEQPNIVRCKDCKHFKADTDGTGGLCMKIMLGCQNWGFCADGEGKET